METILKSILIWMCVLPSSVICGSVQSFVLDPLFGEVIGLNICSVSLCIFIYITIYFMLPKIESQPKEVYPKIGLTWVVSTLIFDIGMRYATNIPESVIFGNYNIMEGKLWIFVILFMGIVPSLVAKQRGLAYNK